MKRHSKNLSRSVVGRDRLKWRRHEGRLFLIHPNKRKPLAAIEPDSECAGMYRIRFPGGGLSDIANLSRAKDAELACALRSLNSDVQETPPDGFYVRQKRSVLVNTRRTAKRPDEPRTGFLAEGRFVKRRNKIGGQS